MKGKRIIFVLVILVSIMSLSGISATDNITDGNYLTTNDNEVDLTGNNNLNVSILRDDSNSGTFTDFQNIVDSAENGSTINIDRNYYYDNDTDNGYISIEKDLIINGNGHTMDANNLSRIFDIYDATVIINNLNFINANDGAIYSDDSGLEINNCSFVNNSVSDTQYGCGGAIYSEGSSLKINNGTFIGNNASKGGAVYSDSSNLEINNCSFVNNSVSATWDSYGGAVYSYESNSKINNGTFIGNNASKGGAIYSESWKHDNNFTILDNCTFVNNTAEEGGALFSECYNLTVKNCSFFNNSADRDGGAICVYTLDEVTAFIYNSTFINNSADSDGGAIYACDEAAIYLYNSTFFNNRASDTGGAIYTDCGYVGSNIELCTFINNTASKAGGLYITYTNVTNSVIIDNHGEDGKDVVSDSYRYPCVLTYNWWGSNKNPEDRIDGDLENRNWILMIFEPTDNEGTIINKTIFVGNRDQLLSGLLRYTDGTNVSSFEGALPVRNVRFMADTGVFDPNNGSLVDNKLYTWYSDSTTNNTLYAIIDYQILEIPTYKVSMELIKIAHNRTVYLGNLTSFTIVVTNTGELTLHNVVVNETDVDGLVFNSYVGENWTKNGNTYTYLHDLAPGESASFNIIYSTVRAGNLTNMVFASSNETNIINATNVTEVIDPNTNKTNDTNKTNHTNNTDNKTDDKTDNKNNNDNSTSMMDKHIEDASKEITNYNTGNPLLMFMLALMACVIPLKRKK